MCACVCVCKHVCRNRERGEKIEAIRPSPSNTAALWLHLFFFQCGENLSGISGENRVNLLSALSHLILFQCSLTHHYLIYKRPFNIHACLGDTGQTLRRRPEIYRLCVLFWFVSICDRIWWSCDLFHLILKQLSRASQWSRALIVFPRLPPSFSLFLLSEVAGWFSLRMNLFWVSNVTWRACLHKNLRVGEKCKITS